ncbi:MAG: ABC transporter permease [Candidatus Acidiferrales bacterium]
MMQTILSDFRYGARMLVKEPGFTLIAILTLALGIGVNTAIFSAVDSVLLKRLPYPDPARLVMSREIQPKAGEMGLAWPNFVDWHGRVQSFEADAAFRQESFTLTGGGSATRIRGAQVSATFFSLVGASPRLGRSFTAAEDAPGGPAVALLTKNFWRTRFGSDPEIVGKSIVLDGNSYNIIGVLPAGLKFSPRAAVYLPIAHFSNNAVWQNRGNHENARCLARLRPGVTLAQAQAEMDAIMERLEQQYPASNAGQRVRISSLNDYLFQDSRFALLVLLGAVAFVLLIACANVANLFLARATRRQKEFAIRATLGAGGWRLIQQLLAESILLSIAGGSAGLLLAYWTVGPLLRFAPDNVPRLADTQIDLRVLFFTLAISIATGILFGLAPALYAAHQDLSSSLKETGASVTSNRSHQRLRSALLVSEVALAIVLVIASGLMVRSMLSVLNVNLGVNPDHVLALDVYLEGAKYKGEDSRRNFFDRSIARVRQLPGVTSSSAVLCTPFTGGCWGSVYLVGDRPVPPQAEIPSSPFNVVDPEYFRTLQIPLLMGRYFDKSDTAQSPPVIIINEAMAKKWWPNESAIGKRIKQGFPQSNGAYREIVGVVGDVKEDGPDSQQRTEVYEPMAQNMGSAMTLMVRTVNDPMTMANTIIGEIHALDADQAVDSVEPLTDYLDGSIAWRKSMAGLLGFFGLLALGLAAIGIYGVMSYTVSQRSHEIGIRMALGARPGQVLQLIVGQGLRMSLIGVAFGLVAALCLTRFFASVLFGVTPRDPVTFATVVLIVVGVAVAGSLVPARRAAKVDPMVALRYE